jgi:transcriptional regulator with XRE-family HTH domain
LAEAAKVAPATIATWERGKRTPYDRTLLDIQAALQAAGVVFVADGETSTGGEGVRIVK